MLAFPDGSGKVTTNYNTVPLQKCSLSSKYETFEIQAIAIEFLNGGLPRVNLGKKVPGSMLCNMGGGGRRAGGGRRGEKPTAYNGLELEEHLSLGSGAGSDLLKNPASRDTSPETPAERCPAFKERKFGGIG